MQMKSAELNPYPGLEVHNQFEDCSYSAYINFKKANTKPRFKEIITKLVKKLKRNDKVLSHYQQSGGLLQNINKGALACFVELCQTLSLNNRVTEVNLSGCNINIFFAIELSKLVQNNTNIQALQLAGCNLNPFSLSCIFKAMIDHTGLTHLNLSNNQSFTLRSIQDFCKYVLRGKNPLYEINLNHCNIDNYYLSIMLPQIINLKSLKRLKVGMMRYNSESLLALASALRNYTGSRSLDFIDISYNYIKDRGLQLLSGALFISVRQINIRSINISRNFITQEGIQYLEQILLKLNVEEINLSYNKISEFYNLQVLSKKMFRINLSFNQFVEIPNNFFLNVFCLDLSNNLISTQGAYQISQVLTSKKVKWKELNLNNNHILTKGFISLVYALIENLSLVSLSVANNSITGEGILVYIFNHEQLRLQYLDLSHNNLRYDLVYALLSMMKECSLATLLLNHLIQDENEIQSLKDDLFEIKCANLKELHFEGNPTIITPILESLAKQYNRIESLNLNNCQLKNEDIDPISRFLQRSYTLQTLLLASNNIGKLEDKSIQELSFGISKCFPLISVDFSNNHLRQNVILLLNGLKECANLRYLNLSKNLIYEDDEIMQKLPQLFRNPNLSYVDLSKNSLKGQSYVYLKRTLQKEGRQLPQINFSYQNLNADDLVAISETISDSYFIRKLELSGNPMLDYLNNVLTFGDKVRVKSLSINKIEFRKDSFSNFINLIGLNYHSLRILEVSNTFLSYYQFITLLQQLKIVKALQALILDYQHFQSEPIIEEFTNLMPVLCHLKLLSIRKCTLSSGFYKVLENLLKESQRLLELDLSDNRIPAKEMGMICDGISQNTSLTVVNLSNCKLRDEHLVILLLALSANKSIRTLDLSQNYLQEPFHQEGLQHVKITELNYLKLDKSYGDFLISNHFLEKKQPLFERLTHLQLCQIQINHYQLQSIADRCQPGLSFQHLKIMNLDQSGIDDAGAHILGNMLESRTKLMQLLLTKNFITAMGLQYLMTPIIEGASELKILNVSQNMVSDQFFCKLESQGEIKMRNFQLLIMDQNRSDGTGGKGFIRMLKCNPSLYIYNDWKGISEELARIIVESYIRFTGLYRIQDESPSFITTLKIEDSSLTDSFFIWLSAIYFRFPRLEYINFNGSKNVSSVSKMHIYINMTNENYVNYNLREAYFEERYVNHSLFDDGMLRCPLIKLKDILQNKNTNKISYGPIDNQIESEVKQAYLTKWAIFILNSLINVLSESSVDFKLSSNLYNYLRKNFKQVLLIFYSYIIFEILKILLSLSTVIYNILYPQLTRDENRNQNVAFLFVVVLCSFVETTINLRFAIQLRKNGCPEYCIVTKEARYQMIYNFIHRSELLTFLVQYQYSQNYYYETQIIITTLLIYESHCNTGKDEALKLGLSLMLFTFFLLFYQIVFTLRGTIKALLELQRTQNSDQSIFLRNLWVATLCSSNTIIEDSIYSFSPQTVVKVGDKLFGYRQLLHIWKALTIHLPFSLLYILASRYKYLYEVVPMSNFYILILYMGFAKSFSQFIACIMRGLITRPPLVKEFDLNEVLVMRRYQGIAMSSTKVQYNLLKKSSKQTSGRAIRNNSLDLRINGVLKTKSERVVTHQIQHEDEDGVHLVGDPDMTIQVPFQFQANKLLKSLVEKGREEEEGSEEEK